MIQVTCGCGKRLKAADEQVDKWLKCPGCGRLVELGSTPLEAIYFGESLKRLAGPFAKAWLCVGVLLLAAIIFVGHDLWSRHAAELNAKNAQIQIANSRVTQGINEANAWIARGSLEESGPVEKSLEAAISDKSATNTAEGERALDRLRQHRRELMLPAVPTPAPVAQITEYEELAPYSHAGVMVRNYLVRPNAKGDELKDLSDQLRV